MGSEHWDDNGCCTLCGAKGNATQACQCQYGLAQQQQAMAQQQRAYRQFAVGFECARCGEVKALCERRGEEMKTLVKERDEARAVLRASGDERERMAKTIDRLRAEKADNHEACVFKEKVAYKRANEHAARAYKLADECGNLRKQLDDAMKLVGQLTMGKR